MNPVAEEIMSYYTGDDTDTLVHYGMPRRSGRYPWGSGEDPYQRTGDFIARIEKLKKEKNFSETPEQIKEYFGMSVKDYRNAKSIAKDVRRVYDIERAKSLREDGLNTSEIGRKMGKTESTIRNYFDEEVERRANECLDAAVFLKDQVDAKKMIDVGRGVERELNISRERMDQALMILEEQGYHVYGGRMDQVTNAGQKTTQTVLCVPGTEHKAIYDYANVKTVEDYISRDGGKTFEKKFNYPESMDSSRLKIRYNEEGGLEKDGIVELRKGVADLSLGESRYAQVRILVDKSHYIKGMAVYGNDKDFPPGVDVIFNTNKKKGTDKMDVLKKIKEDDPENPFGALIKDADKGGQYWYNDPVTGKKKLGLINKRADEGDWTEWSDSLPSQFLSKQSLTLAQRQLDIAKADKMAEYDAICALTNPTVKKHLLQEFANNCDSAAVKLQAAALPGQKYHVMIPINSLKDNEIYAPGYDDGTKLALIRYPHGGTFEIPICTVNNKNAAGKKIIGNTSIDAVGVNCNVANRLSGADFDGDTVMCIPTHDRGGKVKISSTPELSDLVGFDPKIQYAERKGMKYMKDPVTKKDATQMEMGKISNLICDMTLAGASDAEKAAAVKHSMVVIDAGKHKLDYKQSEIDNNIAALRIKYQGKKSGGAATIISKSKGQKTIDKTQGTPKINTKGKPWYDPSRPEGSLIYQKSSDLYYPDRTKDKTTGKIVIKTTDGKKVSYDPSNKKDADLYTPVKRVNPDTGEVSYTDKTGKISYKLKGRTQKTSKMADTDDAYTLVSKAKHPMEILYADYANNMKSLANQARKEMVGTGKIEYKKESQKIYQKEVDRLMSALNEAEKNAVKERAAQRKANAVVNERKAIDPTMSNGDIKKIGQRALSSARQEVGSVSRRDRNIQISDREWAAIQAGAISETKLKRILNNSDVDRLRDLATPRSKKTSITPAQVSLIKSMSKTYTIQQIADRLGISKSQVSEQLKSA